MHSSRSKKYLPREVSSASDEHNRLQEAVYISGGEINELKVIIVIIGKSKSGTCRRK